MRWRGCDHGRVRRVVVAVLALLAGGLVAAALAGPDAVRAGLDRVQGVAAGADGDPGAEAAGDALDGAAGEEPLRYVALGDSIAAGFAAPVGYPELVAEELEARTGRDVDVDVAAQAGWATGGLTEAVTERARVRDALADADVVTVSVGSNDLFRAAFELGQACDHEDCARPAVTRFVERWEVLLDELGEATDAAVVVTDLYDPFTGRDDPDADALASQLRAEANDELTAAAEDRGFAVAEVSTAFHDGDGAVARDLLAFDGIHPGRAGQDRIAEAVLAALDG